MTAEIAILNKVAVALAADSAVSIETSSDTKIYNSNKLFMLSKYEPVGIMVYGSASLMGVPWESIIKTYRRILGDKPFDTLEEYGADFIGYLDKNLFLFPINRQESEVYTTVVSYFAEIIIEEIDSSVEAIIHKSLRVTEAQINRIVNKAIKDHLAILESLPRLTTLPIDFEKEILRKYLTIFDKAIDDAFQRLPLSALNRKQLKRICIALFVRDMSELVLTSSGIVIAGFGKNELYPSVIAYEIECVVGDRLKYKEYYKTKIGEQNVASLLPFAQREMVVSFMEGVAPTYQENLKEYLDELFNRYPVEIVKGFKHLKAKEKAKLVADMRKIGVDLTSAFWNNIDKWAKDYNIDPILSTVSVLPIEELALMAESLVNLTSFKRRVTLVAETVRGPIDVAVISKGDGFIWIKRKHYFEASENRHFFRNYFP